MERTVLPVRTAAGLKWSQNMSVNNKAAVIPSTSLQLHRSDMGGFVM